MSHKQIEPASAATEKLALTPETERSAKEAATSLRHCVAIIEAQQQADIIYDLIAGGQQVPDLLHQIIGEQDQTRAFVAQIQKRIAGGAQ